MSERYPEIGQAALKARQARDTFPFEKPAEIDSGKINHFPVIIAGGGPIGLAMAIDLARHNIRSVVLERSNTIYVS